MTASINCQFPRANILSLKPTDSNFLVLIAFRLVDGFVGESEGRYASALFGDFKAREDLDFCLFNFWLFLKFISKSNLFHIDPADIFQGSDERFRGLERTQNFLLGARHETTTEISNFVFFFKNIFLNPTYSPPWCTASRDRELGAGRVR